MTNASPPALSAILCAGEALIDMVPRPTPEGDAFLPLPGGGVFNTAVAAARLGVPTAFWYGLSDDMFGDRLRAALVAAGVDFALCRAVARPTTLAFVTLAGGQARYLFLDENSAGRMLTPSDLPPLPAGLRALFVGGVSLVSEPVGTAIEALVHAVAQDGAGRLIMMDPNIRPSFIRDAPATRARILRIIARAHVVKLSDEDLTWLAGPGDPRDQARGVQAMGPHLVLVTQGARGALAVARDWEVAVASPAVTVVDTVGAGDTFNAGVLAALWEAAALSPAKVAAMGREEAAAALAFATRAAALSVTRAGADPPWRSEMG